MSRSQIERAERTARRLEKRMETVEALHEAQQWERPKSLSGATKPDDHYTFTEAQLAIAMNVLEKKLNPPS